MKNHKVVCMQLDFFFNDVSSLRTTQLQLSHLLCMHSGVCLACLCAWECSILWCRSKIPNIPASTEAITGSNYYRWTKTPSTSSFAQPIPSESCSQHNENKSSWYVWAWKIISIYLSTKKETFIAWCYIIIICIRLHPSPPALNWLTFFPPNNLISLTVLVQSGIWSHVTSENVKRAKDLSSEGEMVSYPFKHTHIPQPLLTSFIFLFFQPKPTQNVGTLAHVSLSFQTHSRFRPKLLPPSGTQGIHSLRGCWKKTACGIEAKRSRNKTKLWKWGCHILMV